MPPTFFYIVACLIIGALSITLLRCTRTIHRLQTQLKDEHHKRTVPVLALKVDTDQTMAFFLENTGDCVAKNITFHKTDVTLESGFKKTFGLQFNAIDQLNPKGLTPCAYTLYEDAEALNPLSVKDLFLQIAYATFEVQLNYTNIYQTPFKTLYHKEQHAFKILKSAPMDEYPADAPPPTVA